MTGIKGGTKTAGNGEATRPASLREALSGVPIAQRDLYLLMREAFLCLEGTGEAFQPRRRRWTPLLMVGRSEVARIRFGRRGANGQKEMSVAFPTLPAGWLREMVGGTELRPVTRNRLRATAPGEVPVLPITSEADLADVVAVLLLVHARLWHGSHR